MKSEVAKIYEMWSSAHTMALRAWATGFMARALLRSRWEVAICPGLPRQTAHTPACSSGKSVSGRVTPPPGPRRTSVNSQPTATLKAITLCGSEGSGQTSGGTELARAEAAADLTHLNHSVYTNKQAEVTTVAGALNDLGPRERKKCKAPTAQ